MARVNPVSMMLLFTLFLPSNQIPSQSDEQAIAAVLDDWHKAASEANEERYFGHFTPDAIMMGTDATEHWTRDEFRAWAKPYFARGTAWSFTPKKRHVSFSKDRSVAWFDELLDTPQLGLCRGSGVLLLDGGRWRIAQYNLSVPIPNGVFKEVKAVIDGAKSK
jgi:hypothetical protein